jgi:hypothetical protein
MSANLQNPVQQIDINGFNLFAILMLGVLAISAIVDFYNQTMTPHDVFRVCIFACCFGLLLMRRHIFPTHEQHEQHERAPIIPSFLWILITGEYLLLNGFVLTGLYYENGSTLRYDHEFWSQNDVLIKFNQNILSNKLGDITINHRKIKDNDWVSAKDLLMAIVAKATKNTVDYTGRTIDIGESEYTWPRLLKEYKELIEITHGPTMGICIIRATYPPVQMVAGVIKSPTKHVSITYMPNSVADNR